MAEHLSPAGVQRELVLRGSQIRSEVREIGTNPLYAFASKVEHFVAEHPDLVRMYGQWHAVDKIRYAESTLPPDLREPFTDMGHEVPPIPDTEDGVEGFMREYWPYRVQRAPVTSPGITRGDRQHRDDLAAELQRRIREGVTIAPAAWHDYETVHHRQQERAREGTGICLLHDFAAQTSGRSNIAFTRERGVYDMTDGRYDSLLLSATSTPYHNVTPLMAPIGEYGEEFTQRAIRTWAFLVDFAGQDNDLLAATAQQVSQHRQTAENHQFRSIDRDFPGAEEGTIAGIQEGFGSMFSMIFLHAARKQAHLGDNPDVAFNTICENDLINASTGLASLAFAYPLMRYGLFVEDANQPKEGRVVVSEELKSRTAVMRAMSQELALKKWKEYERMVAEGDPDAEIPTRTGLTCPFFGEFRNTDGLMTPGAISRLTKTIKIVYNAMGPIADSSTGMGLPWDIPRFVESIEQPRRHTIGGRLRALAEQGKVTLQNMKNPGECC